jgi:hypothetical protein
MSKREEKREASRECGRAAKLPGYYRTLDIIEVKPGTCKLWDLDEDRFRDAGCRLEGKQVAVRPAGAEEWTITDLDLLRFQCPKPQKARFAMELDFRPRSLGPDYFAKAACPKCGASVQPRSEAEPLDDDRSMSAFYACTGQDRHRLAVLCDEAPYRLVLQAS